MKGLKTVNLVFGATPHLQEVCRIYLGGTPEQAMSLGSWLQVLFFSLESIDVDFEMLCFL